MTTTPGCGGESAITQMDTKSEQKTAEQAATKNGGNGQGVTVGIPEKATWRSKVGLAEMLKGGVIMDVVTPEHAVIAEEAGAAAVMALERVPADIRKHGGVARM